MKLLALETSAKAVSAAVVENGKVLGYAYQNIGLTHSVTMMPMVDSMLKNASLTMEDMGAIAVAKGPGSFTGLRIGVSAAKGLAWAAGLPCCGVSTLEGMAKNVTVFEGLIICAMDARRNQVYNALFRCHNGALERLSEDRAIGLEELCEELKACHEPMLVVGDGAALAYGFLKDHLSPLALAPENCRYQNAVGVALAAEESMARGENCEGRDLTPTYLRLSQAERERLAKGLPITIDKS